MKFIVTRELGRLAKWLRILGYDASYFVSDRKSNLLITSLREDRAILTRNSKIGEHSGVKIVRIKNDSVKEQLKQVIGELEIAIDEEEMFSRCVICNIILEDIEKEEVAGKVPDYVFQTHQDFVRCPSCDRIYWRGTHWGNVQKIIEEIGQ